MICFIHSIDMYCLPAICLLHIYGTQDFPTILMMILKTILWASSKDSLLVLSNKIVVFFYPL